MYAIARDHFLARNIIQEYKKIKREKIVAQRIAREHDAAKNLDCNENDCENEKMNTPTTEKTSFEYEMNSNVITI